MAKRIALLALILLLPICSFAQLTDQDIANLKQQAIDESWTFEVTQNPATEYSIDELCGLVEPPDWRKSARFVDITVTKDLPASFDYRDQGLPVVKNQAGCGSCWAFATVGALECNIMIQDGVEEDLSEQYLVSCNSSGWDCGGGWWAHDYHQWHSDPCGDAGAVFESDFPYAAADLPCGCPYTNREYVIDDWAYVGSSGSIPPESYLKQAILDYGPVSVALYANAAMQSYGGGVFNGCSSGTVNHGVVLVGWDDNDGPGVWIMRNSWGTGWGEDGGYMRIPYYCSEIGYGACFVDYRGGASFEVDTAGGWVPIDIQFTATSGVEVDAWLWDFGDGESSVDQSPVHTYDDPGYFDVTMQAVIDGDTLSRTKLGCVSAVADTMLVADVEVVPDSVVEVVISATNFVPMRELVIPVQFTGTLDLDPNDFTWTTEGCRTEGLDYQQMVHYNPMGKQVTFRLMNNGDAIDVSPGTGAVLKIYFNQDGAPLAGQETTIDISGYSTLRQPKFVSTQLTYAPIISNGLVSYSSCCVGMRGNINGDVLDNIDITDLVYMVNYMFQGGPEPPCLKEANVNGDLLENIDIADLIYLVNYMFQGGPEPVICF